MLLEIEILSSRVSDSQAPLKYTTAKSHALWHLGYFLEGSIIMCDDYQSILDLVDTETFVQSSTLLLRARDEKEREKSVKHVFGSSLNFWQKWLMVKNVCRLWMQKNCPSWILNQLGKRKWEEPI